LTSPPAGSVIDERVDRRVERGRVEHQTRDAHARHGRGVAARARPSVVVPAPERSEQA
jgi:hypothetical protein